MSCTADDCRGGCCREFLGDKFCEVESNCFDTPTWIIVLVPVLLGLTALVLIIITIYKLKNRKVINIYDKIGHAQHQRQHLQGLPSDRKMDSDRPFRH